MAKKKNNPTKETSKNLSANPEMEKSDEVLSMSKEPKKVEKTAKEDKKSKKPAKKNSKPRRNYIKEVFSELKKVSWPTFGQACARTGVVLGVVAIFMFVVLGIDLLLTWLVSFVV